MSEEIWLALSAISTFVAALVALALPFIMRGIENGFRLGIVQRELKQNLGLVRQILERGEVEVTDEASFRAVPTAHPIEIEALAQAISTESWRQLRYSLNSPGYACLAKYFEALDRIREGSVLATSQMAPNQLELARASNRLWQSARLWAEFERESKLCKYLRACIPD